MSVDASMNQDIFSTLEIDTIGEIMNISMGSAATAASTLLDNKVTITTPIVNVVPLDEFDIKALDPAMAVEIQYVEGITGSNILILRQQDIRTLLAQMMQQEIAEDFVVDEIAQSAICELMNQMMGSSATVLSCFLGRQINISTPVSVPIRDAELDDFKAQHFPQKETIITIKFTISIKDVMESEFVSVMDIDLAKEIIDVSLNFDAEGEGGFSGPEAQAEAAPAEPALNEPMPAAPSVPPQAPVQQPPMPPAPAPQPVAAPPQQAPGAVPQQPYYPPQAPYYPGVPGVPGAPAAQAEQPIVIKDYDFGDFGGADPGAKDHPTNLDLVMNVPVVVTVELGRTKRKIKEILEFGQGTVVELDKQAGSQVDLIVNGQLIARGDVVVVDDNFSIRITEILKGRDSLTAL